MSAVPSENNDSLGGGVVRPFLVERRSPNIFYIGDRIDRFTVRGFEYVGQSQMVVVEGGMWPESFMSFRSLIEYGNRTD